MSDVRVFVVDDDKAILRLLEELLGERFSVSVFSDPEDAMEAMPEQKPRVVLSDVNFGGDMAGIEFLKEVKEEYPDISVILMSGHTTTTLAIESIQFGAVDYINKPFENEQVLESVSKAVKYSDLATQGNFKKILHTSIHSKRSERLVGKNLKMLEIYKTIGKITDTTSNVLITGESGTGKELIARMIATMSKVGDGKFMTINCSAIPGTLFESELFGYEKGAFTGADSRRIGKIEAADGGMLFMDEIDTLPLLLQSKILRLIQQKEFQRVGGVKTLRAKVRIVAAAKADIMDQVKQGTFREDLFYRLSVIRIELPPLRERRDDILELFNYFLTETNRKHGKKIRNISKTLLDRIKQYNWPGNVRELENSVERAVILAGKGMLTEEYFPFLGGKKEFALEDIEGDDIDESFHRVLKGIPDSEFSDNYGSLYKRLNAVFEKNLFECILSKVKGNQVEAAKLLGVSRNTLRDRIKRYEIESGNR